MNFKARYIKFLVLLTALPHVSHACENSNFSLMPKNEMRIPVNSKFKSNITKNQFHSLIDKFEQAYTPIARSMGMTLHFDRNWESEKVNASTERWVNTSWLFRLHGGFARHPKTTKDGFTLLLCHEMGHHLGGVPWYTDGNIYGITNEGQADYFATLKCVRKLWLNDNNEKIVAKLKAPETLIIACGKSHNSNKAERALCIRSGMAALSLVSVFASANNASEVHFHTPDTTVVNDTINSHPKYQCRLDTFLQGALCEKSHTEDVSQTDEAQGTCHGSTGHTIGTRPLCWFKPKS